MNKTDVSTFIRNARTSIAKHSPEILTGIGIAGMITTTILAVKATPKALRLLEERKKELWVDELTPGETIKTAWKCYVPAAVTGVASVACLVGASTVSLKRNAAIATAYKLSETALTEYKEKVIETIGEKKEKTVREKIASDKLKNDPVTKHDVIVTDKGTTLCYDAMFGRYFYSDRDEINRAINKLNRNIVVNFYTSLNEFYFELNLNPVKGGNDLGWNIDDGEIVAEFDTQLSDDGRPCLVMSYNVAPKYNYSKLI